MPVQNTLPRNKIQPTNRNVVVDINQVENLPTTTSSSCGTEKVLWIGLGVAICILTAAAFAIPLGIILATQKDETTTTTTTETTTTITTTQSTTTTYGGLANTGIDDEDSGCVVIDYTNVVTAYDGSYINRYVQDVSFNFSVAPSTSAPTIWLYVMEGEESSGDFSPVITYQIPFYLITTRSTGVQTITLPANAVPISENYYMAVGFDTGSGSCYRVDDRSQYYQYTSNFESLSSTNYRSTSYGFAFSFTVKTVVSDSHEWN